MNYRFVATLLALGAVASHAEIKVTTERNTSGSASYSFKNLPSPARNDAASKATFKIVDGRLDPNGGGIEKLNDGRVATEQDQPSSAVFFAQGTDGGRLLIDLGAAIEVQQVNSFSWHASTRGPQVYDLYGSDGSDGKFAPEPKRDVAPENAGWKKLASIDSRPKDGEPGGQYGVGVTNSTGETLGKFRYLLLDVRRTENADPFGNTFYTEIDVIDRNGPKLEPANAPVEKIARTFDVENGAYQITIDTSVAPDLTEWAHKELAPVAIEWYPKLIRMLPSEGFEAPKQISITFRTDMRGTPASAGGSRINCNADWFRRNLKGEARGSVVHELVHVVQAYGRARRTNPNATRAPGWLVEGIPDYIRWFLYEPQTRGAEIGRSRLATVAYNNSYRVSGNFLNWVTETYEKDLVKKLNADLRNGVYTEEFWKTATGKMLPELDAEWKKALEAKLNAKQQS